MSCVEQDGRKRAVARGDVGFPYTTGDVDVSTRPGSLASVVSITLSDPVRLEASVRSRIERLADESQVGAIVKMESFSWNVTSKWTKKSRRPSST